jgi:isoquinoline 1-oxidoreductase subunit beta
MSTAMNSARGAGVSRRRFLGHSAFAGGALVLSFSLPALARRRAAASAAAGDTPVGAWVAVGADESVTVYVGASDMGQGVRTALPQILADEMRVPWENVRAEQAPAAFVYGNPLLGGAQFTLGSTAVRGYYASLRTAGAALREMMITAAANTWGISTKLCDASAGKVTRTDTGDVFTYGQLAPAAAELPVPAKPDWLPDSQLELIGRSVPRTDIAAKVDGSAVFGMDVRLPGMLYAAIRHCPQQGGTLVGIPPTPPGAVAVVPLGNALAVVANSTWEAFVAAGRVKPKWNIPASADKLDTTVLRRQAQDLLATGTAIVAEENGDVAAALKRSRKRIDATYELPYLAHACMEPLNCTASVTPTSCDIWAPTQGQSINVLTAAAITRLPPQKIRIHTTFLGGGLGRKAEQDFIAQAVTISKAIGKPVSLVWPREQDFGNDRYRPMALARVRAGVDASGAINAFWVRSVSPSITAQRGGLDGADPLAVEGSVDLPYALGARRTEWLQHPSTIPVGYWRSVGYSINTFLVESAIDELCAATGTDPYQMRRRLLAGAPRELAVLDAAAQLAGWSTTPAPGRARGIAFCASFGSLCAQVAEVSQDSQGQLVAHRICVAIDCGTAINPRIVQAQMRGGVVHGLSAVLWGQVAFNQGAAQVSNFDKYRVLRMAEMPKVDVTIVNSGEALGGIGEPGVPPLAPAIANAWFKLTGVRVRRLPMFAADAGLAPMK